MPCGHGFCTSPARHLPNTTPWLRRPRRCSPFVVIAAGALGCVLGGILGDRWGRPQAAGLAMTLSGGCALLAGFVYSGPVWLLVAVSLVWGITVVADSAQFSAMVTDMGDPRYVGTTLTLQLGLGFSLTVAPSGSCRCWPASSRVGSGSFSFSCPVQRWASSPCSAYVRPASGVSYVPSMVPTCASVRTRPNRAIDRLRLVAPPARNRVAAAARRRPFHNTDASSAHADRAVCNTKVSRHARPVACSHSARIVPTRQSESLELD
jgi:MFS family permease